MIARLTLGCDNSVFRRGEREQPTCASFLEKTRFLLLMFLLALTILSLSFPSIARVAAQPVGLVCLVPTSVSVCPAPPVTVTGPLGGQLMVTVIVQSSDLFNGFDITLFANHTIIKPASVNVTGSLLSGGTIFSECIGGVLKAGYSCSTADSADTLHLAMDGPLGFFTAAPTSGLLFTAVYNVTGAANAAIGYQTGCSQSSVSGTSTCVQFANGSILPVQETVQGATYTRTPSPTFSLEAAYPILG